MYIYISTLAYDIDYIVFVNYISVQISNYNICT